MRPLLYLTLCAIFFIIAGKFTSKATVNVVPFDKYYTPDWGAHHVIPLDQGNQVQILIDQNSGGGFISKNAHGSGYFRMSLKIPQNSNGIITTFYLTSVGDNAEAGGNHDELDFEFLGGNKQPYILNTNVFAQDKGHREEQFNLWFNPSTDFHDYAILWNQNQIVFFIDEIPIRVYRNNKTIGANYPNLPMYVTTSVWNGTGWLGSTDWSKGPFYSTYRGFDITGCPYDKSNPIKCNSSEYSWNSKENSQLNQDQRIKYENVRSKYVKYDYCKSGSVNNYPECKIQA